MNEYTGFWTKNYGNGINGSNGNGSGYGVDFWFGSYGNGREANSGVINGNDRGDGDRYYGPGSAKNYREG